MTHPQPAPPDAGSRSGLHVAPFDEAERARELVGMTTEQMATFLGDSSRTYGRPPMLHARSGDNGSP